MDLEIYRKSQIVKEIFPKINGLFAHIDFNFSVEKSLLDVMWLAKFGLKTPSPEVEIVQTEEHEVLTSEQLTMLGNMILAIYRNKWVRLVEVAGLEYDPIHNYLDEWEDHNEGTEGKEESITNSRTDTFGKTIGVTGTRTDNLLETETINETEQGSDSQSDNVFGFNSSTAVPSDSSTGSNSKSTSGNNSVSNTGTQQNTQTTTEGGTETRATTQGLTSEGSDNRDRNGKHSGNIGNITTQKMINEEIEVWKWSFINMVLEDVRDFCTLPTYRR